MSAPAGTPLRTASNSAALAQGPFWPSFEQFRVGGGAGLDLIQPGTVGTLHSRSSLYRLLRDEDFQRLIGLASDVHRLKNGAALVVQAARVFAKHRDQESMDLLFHSLSMLSDQDLLLHRESHDQFELTPEEKSAASATEQEEVDAEHIPRPSL